MSRAIVAAAVTMFALAAPRPHAQAPEAPGTATAQVSGTVLTEDRVPAPVPRAVVTLRGEGLVAFAEVTDAQGRFAFAAVPAGRYSMTASKPAFITATYGARRPGRPGTPLSLAGGQVVGDVRLVMARGAAISGTVRDPLGRPTPRVEVLVRPAGVDVEYTIGLRGRTQILTDDRGMYRAYGLAAGTYVVAALPNLHTNSVEHHPMSASEIDAALRGLQGPQPAVPTTAPPPGATPPPAGARKKYVPTFHPGAASQDDATPVTVKAGDDISGVDVALALVSSSSLEGRIIRADGAPLVQPRVIISAAGGRMPVSFNSAPVLQALPRADGLFRYTNLVPGQYRITARDGAGYFATATVQVAGDDLAGVTLALQPGLTLSGRIEFDAASLAPPSNLAALQVYVRPPGTRGGGTAVANNTYLGVRSTASGYVADDGTFEVAGIMPGTYTPSTTVPATWWLRSVMAGGRDVLDEVWTIDRSLTGAVFTYTDKHTGLTGLLQTQGAAPAVEYYVLAVSADTRHWFADSRRTKFAKPASDGRYSFRDLPAGTYVVVALDDFDPQLLGDRAFLDQVAATGVKVTIAEGGIAQMDLKIAR
jgi:hypothetical protein